MNAAQIHLALNHAPLFFSIIGAGLLVLGMIKKNELLKTLSLYLLVAAALFTAPVFLTGEGTEELVEKAAGVTENAIESHEEMAKISLVIIIITGVMALAGLFTRKKESLSRIVLMAVVLLSLASFGTMAQTAHLGGLIRHSELQNAPATGSGEQNNNDKDDDEKKNNKGDDD